MSSSGFNRPTATDFRHPSHGLGFGTTPDPFASISQHRDSTHDEDDAIDFDDTYDGLGDDLEEADDDFNDDTFGGEQSTKEVGRDFDFYGSTSKVTSAINEESLRYNRHPPSSNTSFPQPKDPKQASKPYRTGYEAYKNPMHIPDLQVDPSLWGTSPSASTQKSGSQAVKQSDPSANMRQQSGVGVPAKKMISLEEVEAAMRAQPVKSKSSAASQHQGEMQIPSKKPQIQDQAFPNGSLPTSQPSSYQRRAIQVQDQPENIQFPYRPQVGIPETTPKKISHHEARPSQVLSSDFPTRASLASQAPQAMAPPQIIHRDQVPSYQATNSQGNQQPRQILQNPSRHSGQFTSQQPERSGLEETQHRGPLPSQNSTHVPLPIIYHPSQIMNLTEEERNAYLAEEAKRAKRNHKIFLLSKGNGLMTPQDKNFIARIQLQQLMTATGDLNEQDPDSLSEDFYHQVYSQIENRPRQNPQQPLSNFAQTYLFRTGGRPGVMGRRQRGGDNHVQRMEQQVLRAVEAAKAKPKNKQLIIEGSLGKISFSNAKTPKPLLNIKRHDSSDIPNRAGGKKSQQPALSTSDRKTILKNIEAVYSTLLKLEDHDRRFLPASDESSSATVQAAARWENTSLDLKHRLWIDLKVEEPIMPDSTILHPFIAFLSYPKGKKAMPRIFNYFDHKQRLTILAIIVVHLDILDVIRPAKSQPHTPQPSVMAHEQIDLFLQAVMPSLFLYVTEADLQIVTHLLSLLVERVNMSTIVRTRVGLEVLTMFLSRAAIVKAIENPDDKTWNQWLNVYNHFFDLTEPFLGDIFPSSVNMGQDECVWQFLAATGSGANPEHQQRLVLAVKDRVMDTLQQSKTLPPEIASQRRGNVNLFMQAIGLDVDLLDS